MFFQGMIDCYGYVLLIGVLMVVVGAVYGLTYPEDPETAVGGFKMGQAPEAWGRSQKRSPARWWQAVRFCFACSCSFTRRRALLALRRADFSNRSPSFFLSSR